jgi:hypothetical protein
MPAMESNIQLNTEHVTLADPSHKKNAQEARIKLWITGRTKIYNILTRRNPGPKWFKIVFKGLGHNSWGKGVEQKGRARISERTR